MSKTKRELQEELETLYRRIIEHRVQLDARECEDNFQKAVEQIKKEYLNKLKK